MFLLVFFITGGVMIMHETFPKKDLSQFFKEVEYNPLESDSSVLSSIRITYDIEGSMRKQVSAKERIYTYKRPGYRAEIVLPNQGKKAFIRIKEGNLAVVMKDYHRLIGFDGVLHTTWAIFYDLACIALILFGITGLYLWFKTEKNKMLGALFLLISTATTLFIIIYLWNKG
jgi:hypothetical protein